MSRSLIFYLARLSQASLPELGYRLRHVWTRARARRALRTHGRFDLDVPPLTRMDIDGLVLPELCGTVDQDRIDRILRGENVTHGTSSEAIRSIETDLRSTYTADIVISQCPIDIRSIWEPARLQHLSYLIAAMQRGQEPERDVVIRDFVRKELLCWLRNNPFLHGPHYLSAMECGLRLPVFLLALKLLDNLSPDDFAEVASAAYEHAWWIEKNLSLYSSLGNHTICEAVGLVFAGALFRHAGQGKHWLDRGVDLLTQELSHQILPDGGPVEQSFAYHRFIVDLYWLAADFLERNKVRNMDEFKERLLIAEEFLAAMRHDSAAARNVGDSDDGYALAPGLAPRRGNTESPPVAVMDFPHSGYIVMRGPSDVVLTFDHGPLGMPPLYNHGHADALSITLSCCGQSLLVDPGTYRYNVEAEFRAYFKGTRAHNTVTIDGEDQAIQKTGFIWQSPFKVSVIRKAEFAGIRMVEAMHDGYMRLSGGVCHKRLVTYFDDQHFLIKDTFSGEGMHRYELNYHTHPEANVQSDGKWWRIEKGGRNLFLKVLDFDVVAVSGQEDPPLGWFSDCYGTKRESTVLQCSRTGCPQDVAFVTVVCIDSKISRVREEEVLGIL